MEQWERNIGRYVIKAFNWLVSNIKMYNKLINGPEHILQRNDAMRNIWNMLSANTGNVHECAYCFLIEQF